MAFGLSVLENFGPRRAAKISHPHPYLEKLRPDGAGLYRRILGIPRSPSGRLRDSPSPNAKESKGQATAGYEHELNTAIEPDYHTQVIETIADSKGFFRGCPRGYPRRHGVGRIISGGALFHSR